MPLVEGVLSLVGGLGLFLYAIFRLGDGVQKMAGERIRAILETRVRGPLSSIFTGFRMAAALQSNILTFGMVSGLVNAGLLGLWPALWIMLGVNLGLTVTAQLMALNIGVATFILLFAGYLFWLYGKKRNLHYLGQVVFSLALMYLGFEIFHQSFQTLAAHTQAAEFIRGIFLKPWSGFLLGLTLAAVLRSSNTVVVLTQGIIGVDFGLNPSTFLSGAIAIIIGANVGASVINMLVDLDRLSTARKANWFQFSFNMSLALLWLILIPFAFGSVNWVSQHLYTGFQWFKTSVFQWRVTTGFIDTRWFNVWQLAMAHSLFNMSVILLWFPVTIPASKWRFFNHTEKNTIGSDGTTYLDRRALQSPALALILATHEINQMALIALEMLKSARLAFLRGQVHLLDGIYRDETTVDDLQEQITFYLSALLSQNSLTEAQSRRLAGLLHVVSDIERVGDHANSIANLAEKKYQEQLPFSEIAINELELFFGKSLDLYLKACEALRENNLEIAKQIENREANIDKLEEELRQNHIHRLNQGKCWPGSGVVYVEMLSNLLRIAAHSANIAVVVLEEGEQ
ncbi:MAG: Na/Pi cotransporter family protein [Bacillota bacterium]